MKSSTKFKLQTKTDGKYYLYVYVPHMYCWYLISYGSRAEVRDFIARRQLPASQIQEAI